MEAMMSIKGFKSQQALQQKLSGFTEEQSIDPARYVTVQEMSGRRHALDVLVQGAYQISVAPITILAGSNIRKIIATAHGASKSDVIRLADGTQFSAISIPDTDTIITSVELDSDPTGKTFTIWRHITPAYNVDGSLNVSVTPSPLSYHLNGVTNVVNRDTTTPANTRALPVEIMGASGMVLNVTTGDLNIQTSHNGSQPDSIQIGDGTTVLGITVSNEAKVSDSASHTALGTLNTSVNTLLKPADTLTKVTTVDTITNTVTVSSTNLDIRDLSFATDKVDVSGSSVSVGNFPATQPISAIDLDIRNLAFATDLVDVSGSSVAVSNFPATQAVSATNLDVRDLAFATDKIDVSGSSSVGVTGAFWQTTQPVSLASAVKHFGTMKTSSFNEITNLTTIQTFTAPANAIGALIQTPDTNTANIRFRQGAATTTSGLQLQPARSENIYGGSNITVCAESGTQAVSIIWWVEAQS
jgi:hypothetical protein